MKLLAKPSWEKEELPQSVTPRDGTQQGMLQVTLVLALSEGPERIRGHVEKSLEAKQGELGPAWEGPRLHGPGGSTYPLWGRVLVWRRPGDWPTREPVDRWQTEASSEGRAGVC